MDVIFVSTLLDPLTLSLFLTILVCFLTWLYWYKLPENSPPGTRGLPFLGILHQMRSHPEKIFQKLGEKYGPLYMVRMAWFDVVVIGDPEIAYEAFAKTDYFNDRPQSFAMLSGKYGVIMINRSDFHKEQRRFGLLTLRALGMGRRNLEPSILEILNDLCNKVSEISESGTDPEPFSISPMLYDAVYKIISTMIFGTDVAQDNKEFKELVKILSGGQTSRLTSLCVAIMGLAPSLKYAPLFSTVWKKGLSMQSLFHTLIKTYVEDHKNSLDINNPRDLIDHFLIQMNSDDIQKSELLQTNLDDEDSKFSKNWKPLSSFTEKQLVGLIRDLFVAGLDTSSSTLGWIVLYLSKYEDVQRKMHQEILNVLGESKLVSMSVSEKLPYVRAVIQEVTRIRPLVPLSAPHLASQNATLRGYSIPKDAIILTNIWAIHHDPKRWPEPEKFLPERHLNSEGKFTKSSNWMHFNVGARSCLGQQLANMELFMTTVMLFQRFHFSLPPGEEPNMDGYNEVALKANPYRVIATKL